MNQRITFLLTMLLFISINPLFAQTSFQEQVREVVIIDESVDDRAVFYRDLKAGVVVHEMNLRSNGLEQLGDILKNYKNIEALHVISHGSDGEIKLGNSVINQQVLQANPNLFNQLKQNLLPGADVLFYGCNLASGEKGKDFLSYIAAELDADVAASNTLTGNARFGGDWVLEVATGTIEHQLPFSSSALANWQHVLPTFDGDGGSPSGATYTETDNGDGVTMTVTWIGGDTAAVIDAGGAGGTSGNVFYPLNGGLTTSATIAFSTGVNITSLQYFEVDTSAEAGNYTFTVTSGSGSTIVKTQANFANIGGFDGVTVTPVDWTNVTLVTITSTASGFSPGFDTIQYTVVTNNSPTATGVPTDLTVAEETASNFDLSAVNFADADGDALSVTLVASTGIFAATTSGGVTVGGSGTGSLTLAGTAANINTYLDTASNIQYTGATDVVGNDAATFTINANDGTVNPQVGSGNIDISNVNDDPTVSGLPTDVTVTEEIASNLDLSASTFSDVDSAGTVTSTLTASTGIMAASSGGSVTIGGSGTGTLTLVGTISNINTYLDTASNVQYTGATNVIGNDAATVSVTLNDGDGSGNVALGTINLDITNVNDDPTLSGLPTDVTVTEETSSNLDLSASTFSDVDSVGTVTTTLIASTGTMAASSGGSVTIGGSGTGTLTLVGTISNINTYLDTASNVQYTGATNVIGNDAATVSVTLNDGDGSGNVALGTINLDIINVNDDPTLSGLPTDVTVSEETASNLDLSSSSFADVDSTGSVTSTLTVSTGTLAASSGGSVVIAGSGTGTLSLIGTIANINTYLNTASAVQYTGATGVSGNDAATVSVTLNDGDGSGNVSLGTVNLDITALPPVISSATYDVDAGIFVVTGVRFVANGGGADVDVSLLTITGESGATYTLTSPDVEISSAIGFTFTLNGTDKIAINALLNKNGINSADNTPYNLAAADDWNTGADLASNTADLLGNSITVSNLASVADAPSIGTAVAGNGQASVSFSAPANNGGSAITAYTATSSPGGLTASGATSPLTVSGLTNGTAYTFSVTATNSSGTGIASSASNSVTPKATQSITFVNPGAQSFGTTPTLSATASSSLTPTFTSSTTGVCTITSGGVLSFITIGSCTINANQAGNGTYSPATQVSQSFSVNAVVAGAPTIGTATADDAQASVSFSAPTSNGSSAITSYTATSSPGGLSVSGATSPLTVTGLTNGTAYTFSVTATNSAGISAASASSNSVTPKRANSAPVVTNSNVSLDEDTSLSISFTATDAESDVLSFEVLTGPTSGKLDKHGAAWLYTPNANFNGDDSVSFIAKDAELSSLTGVVSIKVNAVNDEPKAVDDSFSNSQSANNSYTLAVLDNDTDVDGETLTIDGAAADVGTVQIADSQLKYQAPVDFIGPVTLRYSVSDGHKGRSNAKVQLLITGANSADLPVITVPADIIANATGLFTQLKLGVATAVDNTGKKLAMSLVNTQQLFAPGEHLAYWQATDSDGRSAIKSQKVTVHPLISISRHQTASEGSQAQFKVFLNGPSPQYPVSIPYTVSGSSDANDHDLVDGVVEITSGLSASFSVNVFDDGVTELDEELIISLDSSLNLSSQNQTRLLISEANIAPQAGIQVTQANEPRTQVGKQDGKVYIKAISLDVNQQDHLTETWSTGTLVLESDVNGRYFDPSTLNAGAYPISLVVTDDGTPQLSTKVQLTLLVKDALPMLTGDDSDGDLIPDNQEGFADTDGDGIADYLDAINECNVLQEQISDQLTFLAESQSGVCLRLGTTAMLSGKGIQLQEDALIKDALANNLGGLFDFELTDIPKLGDSVAVVIPQTLPVPANAVYRKFIRGNWQNFVLNANNSVMSSAGNSGYCPPPGSSLWQQGLNEGHWCVQLTIEDGGPNDDDNLANGTVVDPGGVAVMFNNNTLPIAVADAITVSVNQSVDIDVLENDSDVDDDTLTVSQVSSQFGTAVVLDNQQISYMPAEDFIGTDVLIYSISDSKGGTASTQLTVTVVANQVPIAVDDTASTDDKTSLVIDVLSNDTDPEDQTLSIITVSAQHGSAVIENNKIRYTPASGFEGVDTVSYNISDGEGGEATANVLVSVKAYKSQVVDNQSGGSVHWLWSSVLLLILILRRKCNTLKLNKNSWLSALVILFSVNQVHAQGAVSPWYLDATIGFSETDNNQADLQQEITAGQISSFDNSDTSMGLSLGYQMSSLLAFELGYFDLGEGSARINGESLDPIQYHESVKSVSPILPQGVTIGARFTLIEHQNWRFSVPVGLFTWQSEVSSQSQGKSLTTKLDGTDWYAGMHVDYQLSKRWFVGLEGRYMALAPNDILSYQLNLRYQF